MVAKTEPEPQHPTLTLEEFAALERIGMTECRSLARRNAFPFPVLRLGREYRISRKAYDAWHNGDSAGVMQTTTNRHRPRLILCAWTPFAIPVWLDTTSGTFGGERIWMLDLEYLGQAPTIMVITVWVIGLLATAAFVLNRRDV